MVVDTFPVHTSKLKPEGATKKVPLFEENPEKTVVVGGDLPLKMEEQLLQCLKRNANIFAWSPEDVPGVSRQIIEHHLNVYPDAIPSKQRLRKAPLERQEIIMEEVTKLLQAGIIREIDYTTWLAKPSLSQKENNTMEDVSRLQRT